MPTTTPAALHLDEMHLHLRRARFLVRHFGASPDLTRLLQTAGRSAAYAVLGENDVLALRDDYPTLADYWIAFADAHQAECALTTESCCGA